ncbi:histone-lysine N-methyltransferase SETMAR [Plakobranchus ocellatus]|uniref:Histone-lysine N-methyltransferase SETMAR n=1 Tax=Plakobranchus ocellatus TaxID=259542 RepID=A0AAV4A362_9GAST|nr:histone-lysine N-methyltransferase SETMAR [Plakobranchus ocellatus]
MQEGNSLMRSWPWHQFGPVYAKGVILLDILPQGQCINAARYCSTLDRLKEAIRRKRPGLLRRGVVLQHDNAIPHSANLTQQWLQRYGWEILPHPAHSPDLAPSDFHLFGPLKRHLGGMAFEIEDDLISELRNWFDNLDVDFFRVVWSVLHINVSHHPGLIRLLQEGEILEDLQKLSPEKIHLRWVNYDFRSADQERRIKTSLMT